MSKSISLGHDSLDLIKDKKCVVGGCHIVPIGVDNDGDFWCTKHAKKSVESASQEGNEQIIYYDNKGGYDEEPEGFWDEGTDKAQEAFETSYNADRGGE